MAARWKEWAGRLARPGGARCAGRALLLAGALALPVAPVFLPTPAPLPQGMEIAPEALRRLLLLALLQSLALAFLALACARFDGRGLRAGLGLRRGRLGPADVGLLILGMAALSHGLDHALALAAPEPGASLSLLNELLRAARDGGGEAVALAVLEKSEDPNLTRPLLLGIAYAASVGGMGTPIGTPPNVVFMGVYSDFMGTEFSFVEWMSIGLPVVAVMVPVVGLWLTRRLSHKGEISLPAPSPWSTAEVRVAIVFGATALAWITRKEPLGGWTEWFGAPYSNDAMVAFLAVVVMFLVPNGKGGRLLDWETANRIPWGMLILFGAGLTIASAFASSGLSEAIGSTLGGIAAWHVLAVMGVICLSVTFLTETTSNTATTTLLMPILAAAALGAGMDPRLLMIPAAMSASCAFMLPVATAPNVIMFGTGRIPVEAMAREGFALNLIGAAVIASLCYLLVA